MFKMTGMGQKGSEQQKYAQTQPYAYTITSSIAACVYDGLDYYLHCHQGSVTTEDKMAEEVIAIGYFGCNFTGNITNVFLAIAASIRQCRSLIKY